METGLLYSGGKDSTLAALLLEDFCEVTVLCCSFGLTADHEHAMKAAESVGLSAQRVDLETDVAREAVERIVADGYPRHGIQMVHEHALETAASLEFEAVADGTRRDDRVPTVDRPLAQSLEDRYGISHLAPLAGYGRAAIDALASEQLVVESGPSDEIPKGDYETELRALAAEEYGSETVTEIFPEHVQSRVIGRR